MEKEKVLIPNETMLMVAMIWVGIKYFFKSIVVVLTTICIAQIAGLFFFHLDWSSSFDLVWDQPLRMLLFTGVLGFFASVFTRNG